VVFTKEIIQELKGLNKAFNQCFPNEQQIKYQNKLLVKILFIVNGQLSILLKQEYDIFILKHYLIIIARKILILLV